MKEFIFGWTAWFFCEVNFNWPDKLWCWIPDRSYQLGNKLYAIAYEGQEGEEFNIDHIK